MNRARTTRIALLVALSLTPAAVAAGAGGPEPRVAVVAASGGVTASAAAAARGGAEAARQAGADAISPDEVARTLRAVPADAACATDAACAVATCAAVRADYLLVASVTEAASGWRVELRLRDGKRGSIRGQGAETVAREERAARESAARLAQRLVGSLLFFSGELPPPAAAAHPAAPAPGTTAATASTSSTATPMPTSRGSTGAALEAASRGAPTPAPSSRRAVGNVILGTGAALLAGAAASGALAWSASNDASASLARGDLGGFAFARRSSRALAWTGVTLGGVGGVALGAGAWLRLGGSSRVSFGLEPGAAGARVAIAF